MVVRSGKNGVGKHRGAISRGRLVGREAGIIGGTKVVTRNPRRGGIEHIGAEINVT